MIQVTPQMRILLAVEPVDFRNHSARLIMPSMSRKQAVNVEYSAVFTLCNSE